MLKDKLKFLDEHIAYKIKEDRGYLVKRVAESRSNNIDNGRKIWQVNWKVKRKDETPHFIITVKEKKRKKEEILEEYQMHYESLLQARQPENLQEEKIEQEISKNHR